MFTEELRGRIYAMLAPLQVVLVSFGLLSDEAAALWASVVTAALGLGLAAINSHTWRKYLYGFIAPVQAVLMYYGVASEHQLSAVAALVATALGLGVAAAKTPHHEE